MSAGFIVAGTDTGIGKTVFSAGLVSALDGYYWKPIQAGLEGETDSDAVRRLSKLPHERILPEAYRLRLPASPHIAAAREGIAIEARSLTVPVCAGPLVIEGAGGLACPLVGRVIANRPIRILGAACYPLRAHGARHDQSCLAFA